METLKRFFLTKQERSGISKWLFCAQKRDSNRNVQRRKTVRDTTPPVPFQVLMSASEWRSCPGRGTEDTDGEKAANASHEGTLSSALSDRPRGSVPWFSSACRAMPTDPSQAPGRDPETLALSVPLLAPKFRKASQAPSSDLENQAQISCLF